MIIAALAMLTLQPLQVRDDQKCGLATFHIRLWKMLLWSSNLTTATYGHFLQHQRLFLFSVSFPNIGPRVNLDTANTVPVVYILSTSYMDLLYNQLYVRDSVIRTPSLFSLRKYLKQSVISQWGIEESVWVTNQKTALLLANHVFWTS